MLTLFILLISSIEGFVLNPLGNCRFSNNNPIVNFKYKYSYNNKDIFPLETISNNNIKNNIKLSLQAWNKNHPNFNLNIKNKGINATILVSTLDESVVGLTRRYCNKGKFTHFIITINSNKCFYMNNSMCLVTKFPFNIIIFLLLLIQCIIIISYFYKNNGNKCKYFVYMLLIIEVLLLFGNLIFCFKCHSFKNTLIHEIGHILGLGHVNQRINLGNRDSFDRILNYNCNEVVNFQYIKNYDDKSIMKTHFKVYEDISCISYDDLNGINYLYKYCNQLKSKYCVKRDNLFDNYYFIILITTYLLSLFIICCIISYTFLSIYIF